MLKIDHPPNQFYSFVICENCVLVNVEYWSCAEVNIRGSTGRFYTKFSTLSFNFVRLSFYIIYTEMSSGYY